ncbi:MAG: PTS sugar transporter subunit IIA [Kiritimatiellae bacterium]|nr:PTS sugar transporter subunit IIA [Kiritimatiellia bacterium]MDD5520640.1 PTS sugar transporter subunit IIA [Kiritimatiellia bacterium]
MPHRIFNIKEAAAYLHLSTADLETLVKERNIPCEKLGSRISFRRKDIDSWASRRILQFPEQHLANYHSRSSEKVMEFSKNRTLMPIMITVERINPSLTSRTKKSVIRDMVALADQTNLISDSKDLILSLEEREKLCSTAMPGGLALLHPRQHEPYMFTESFIVLGRNLQAIHFGAPDGEPTRLFFLVCCQDDRIHLHTLARLCTMCQKTNLLNELFSADSAKEILASILHSEEEIIKDLREQSGHLQGIK